MLLLLKINIINLVSGTGFVSRLGPEVPPPPRIVTFQLRGSAVHLLPHLLAHPGVRHPGSDQGAKHVPAAGVVADLVGVVRTRSRLEAAELVEVDVVGGHPLDQLKPGAKIVKN